jgi:surface glycoprotein (TIGR04207 family)
MRALFLAALMVFSVFGGTIALAGTAAAGNVTAGNFGSGLPDGPTDNTVESTTAPGRTVEVGDVSFGTSGAVNNVTVDVGGNISVASVDSVRVTARNETDGVVVDQASASYDTHGTLVELGAPANNTTESRVDNVVVTAKLSGSAADNENMDANLTFAVNPTATYDTQATQTVVVSDTFVRAAVSSTQDPTYEDAEVQFVNVDTGTIVATATTDSSGLTPSVQVGPGQNYTAVVNETGFFQASSNTREVLEGDTEELDVTLTPRGIPKDINVIAAEPASEQAPADGTSEIAYYVQVTGQFGDNQNQPLNSFQVNADEVNDDVSVDINGTSASADPAATDVTREVTLPNGTSVNGTVVFTITDNEVEQANVSYTVDVNQSIVDFAQPTFGVLAGEGTIQGQVVAEDTTSGLEDARVHAVTYSRFIRNEIDIDGYDIGGGDTDYFRVVNATTGDVVDADDYRVAQSADYSDHGIGKVEFLNQSDKGVGSGFFVKDLDASDADNVTDLYIVPLEPGDYEVQVSETAPNATREASPASQGTEFFTYEAGPFTATENLTYANAEEQSNPYDEGGPVLADMTDEDGDYVLSKLYTEYQNGEQYVVVGEKVGYSTDFIDVFVTERGANFGYGYYGTFEEDGDDENLNLKPRDVTPTVNVTNVGFKRSLDAEIQPFANQTDAFEQTIIRDGSYVDVVNVTTTAEETDEPVDATVTLEVEDDFDFNGDDDGTTANGTNLAGEWQDNVISGEVVSVDNQNDTITITTGADGYAQVWYQADRSVETYGDIEVDGFIRATALSNLQEPDTTDKRFVGITQYGSISGIVTDADNNGIGGVEVYPTSFSLAGYVGSERVELTPLSTPNPDQYRITVYNASNGVVESHVVNRSEIDTEGTGYYFSDFSTSVRTQYGLIQPDTQGFTLVTETRADGTYTLPRVPAKGTSAQFSNLYNMRGVSDLGNDGQAQAFPGVGSTDDANIVIPEAAPGQAVLSNLQPDGATVTAGTTINPSVTVENTGSEPITRTVEFGLDLNENGELDASEVLDSEDVTVAAAGSEQVTFTVDTTGVQAGTYTHIASTQDSSETATITIESGDGQTGVIDQYDADDSGTIDDQELLDALADYPETLSDQDLLQLLSVYESN